ncbi:hypothetical protein ABG79_02083 [Caloramator mitchellensis]|uniref:Tetratricopeptide repeat protein n=1 Tax=Caloramator mitchellensis TaxID=908809 RepID=A0A0R3JRN7_CALMK|nr:hypothetical protein [Caloramator mitchellensis]KRQ86144.1 hypothetical protein ABG79_02083 [Caloramator mitchellensis]
MLRYHDTDDIERIASPNIIENYKKNFRNFLLSSIVAGFHRTFGIRHEGINMSLEIISSIEDDTENLLERNLLIWNLYVLAQEYIEEGNLDKAMNFIERAEKNWSRDVLLGDELGVYHVSWIEQLWYLKAQIYMLLYDEKRFQSMIDRILFNRYELFKNAEIITGEKILNDRCTYNCFEILGVEQKRKDIYKAINFIKQAILIKSGLNMNDDIAKLKNNPYKYFDSLLSYYYKIQDYPYDNIKYLYCASCKYFDGEQLCNKFSVTTDKYKACSNYEG